MNGERVLISKEFKFMIGNVVHIHAFQCDSKQHIQVKM